VIGFKNIRESLRGASKSGTLAHSHILVGPDGIGKSPMARSLARLILDPDTDQVREYVDITEIRPKGKSIGVDEVRRIIGEANVMPFEGRRKVIIIYDAQLLTIQAQNGLLKTIEEPAAGVYFILLTQTLDTLLPTIQSRCAIHRLFPISREEMAEYINSQHHITDQSLDETIAIARGIPGEADSYIKDPKRREFYDFILEFLTDLSTVKSLQDRNCIKILIKNKAILELGPEEFLQGLLWGIRDLACLKTGKDYKNLIFLYNIDRMRALAQRFTMARLTRIVDLCESAGRLLEPGRNINRETVVDRTLFQLVEET